jgi:PEP-CTERM motif-containing protein
MKTTIKNSQQLRWMQPAKISAVLVLTMVFTICSTAWANTLQPIIKSPHGVSTLEGSADVSLTFKVYNPNNFTLILDYAFCSITHGPPDTSDFANFSGNNGDAGLLGGALIIPGMSWGDYSYSFTPVSPADYGTDYGHDPVFFAIEMRKLDITPPPINVISSAIGSVVWIDSSGQGEYPLQPALGQILNLQNPQPNLLYNGGAIGIDAKGNPFGLSYVDVYDTPEPSSLLLLGSGLVSVAGLLRKRLPTNSRQLSSVAE